VGIDHRCFDILVPQQFLYRADVVAIFQSMGCKAVTKGVASDSFLNPSLLNSLFNYSLQTGFMQMMTTNNARAGAFRKPQSRKDKLPNPFSVCMGILPL
jgi:hypothetical protein